MVGDGGFLEDLFYCLNVIPIRLPALRDRTDDVPLIAEHFLAKYTREMGKLIGGFSAAALDRLKSYPWPGNVRELENVIERAVALEVSDRIQPEALGDLCLEGRPSVGLFGRKIPDAIPPSGFNLEQHLQDIERTHIERALKQADGVQVRAADLLGLSFRQFRYLAKKYGVR